MPSLVGDLTPSVPNEHMSSNIYLTCPVLWGSKTDGWLYILFTERSSAQVWRCHDSTSKNTITLLNFPYIHSHIQSHSPRAPLWPSPPAFCGLVLPANQYVVASPA